MKNKNENVSLERAYDIIKKPITTEKSTNLQQFNQYSFVVSKNSLMRHTLFLYVKNYPCPNIPQNIIPIPIKLSFAFLSNIFIRSCTNKSAI